LFHGQVDADFLGVRGLFGQLVRQLRFGEERISHVVWQIDSLLRWHGVPFGHGSGSG
jgi:hypothetical protein